MRGIKQGIEKPRENQLNQELWVFFFKINRIYKPLARLANKEDSNY